LLRWCNIEPISAAQALRCGLPQNCGALLLKLLESTKSHQSTQVDMVLCGPQWQWFCGWCLFPGGTGLPAPGLAWH
jgi:hypothetical protein